MTPRQPVRGASSFVQVPNPARVLAGAGKMRRARDCFNLFLSANEKGIFYAPPRQKNSWLWISTKVS
jgi:hypothetical protein